jgi:hypothetical protein
MPTARLSTKIDNADRAKGAKVEIREHILAEVKDARVLDCFAGSGGFYNSVWKRAKSYVGCDTRYFPDGRAAFVCDNRRMLRAVDLYDFNVFDLDAYGLPWEQAIIIAARRKVKKGETIGIVFTEAAMTYKNNTMAASIAELTGLESNLAMYRRRQEILDTIVAALAKRMEATIARRWQATSTRNASMCYGAIVLKR